MIKVHKRDEDEIRGKLQLFIRDNFRLGNGSTVLNKNDSFMEKGIIDSTGVLELVSYIEETFNITVEDDELVPDNLDSLNKITTYITKKIGHVGK